MGDPVHQMFINLMCCAVFSFVLCLFLRAACLINGDMSLCCLSQKLFCLTDTVCHFTLDNRFSCKAIHRNLCVCCHDNAVSLGDLCLCENILGSAASSCLHFDAVAKLFRFLFECLSCHVSVCDTGRTSCDCEDELRSLCRCLCRLGCLRLFLLLFLGILLCFRCIDNA